MLRIATLFVLVTTAPLDAQDYTGNVDPSAYSRPLVMHSAIDAQARRTRASASPTRAQKAACAKKERFRAQYGAGNAQVRRLYHLCRGIGR